MKNPYTEAVDEIVRERKQREDFDILLFAMKALFVVAALALIALLILMVVGVAVMIFSYLQGCPC